MTESTRSNIRTVFATPEGPESLPSRQELMTIYTNPAASVSPVPRSMNNRRFTMDDFTNKQHRGQHCLLCSKSNDKSSKKTPLLRIGQYRGYQVCKKTHLSEVGNESQVVEMLHQIYHFQEPSKEITLSKVPVGLQDEWRRPYPNMSAATTCDGFLDTLPNPTHCSSTISGQSIPIWLHDMNHNNVVRRFCCVRCAVFFWKNKYPGNKRGRRPTSN